MRIVLENDPPRKRFHVFKLLAQLAIIAGGLFHLDKLLGCQGDGDSFLLHFTRPLVAGTSGFACGAILDRSLADVADPAQKTTKPVVLALGG